MKIFLIGLPGSGKTTLGKKVALSLNIPFLDLDHEIEKLERKSVREIFAQEGENAFRKKESNCLKGLAHSETDFILATGGGSPCFFDNMEVMNKSGQTIFLNVPLSEILTRLSKSDLALRPLFSGLSADEIKAKLMSLYQERLPFYSKAKTHLTKENLKVEEILDIIKA